MTSFLLSIRVLTMEYPIPKRWQRQKPYPKSSGCLVPRRLSFSMKMCAQRKAGRRQRARLRLLSVSFPWSFAVHHQSLASTLRKTIGLRSWLVEWYLLAGPCSLYTTDSMKVTLGIGDWMTRKLLFGNPEMYYSNSQCPKQLLLNQPYILLTLTWMRVYRPFEFWRNVLRHL